LEEALELAQATGCSQDEVQMLVNYVYSRPAGQLDQEVGGTLVTLAGLCTAMHIEMESAGNSELKRNWERINAIRDKQATKPQGSPLPQ
jgi:hypothetical protein